MFYGKGTRNRGMDHAAKVTELHYRALNAPDPEIERALHAEIDELCIDLTDAEVMHSKGAAIARWSTQ